MILSASRRTDIPNYYSEWFLNRIDDGYLHIRNPFNKRISRIDISPKNVECIVFWTKNPSDMLNKLGRLREYNYYFQFTITGYGRDIEPNIPDKKSVILPAFKELSRKIGKERVIWRYDPIFINKRYTAEYILHAFESIAESLNGFTDTVIISFIDIYKKIKKKTSVLEIEPNTSSDMLYLAQKMADTAKKYGLSIRACSEQTDLSQAGIERAACIDKKLIEQLTGLRINGFKDKNQRSECGCMESIDVGAYNTCKNGCIYCYANRGGLVPDAVCDPRSPLLCGSAEPDEEITQRILAPLENSQPDFFEQ